MGLYYIYIGVGLNSPTLFTDTPIYFKDEEEASNFAFAKAAELYDEEADLGNVPGFRDFLDNNPGITEMELANIYEDEKEYHLHYWVEEVI